VFSLFFPHFFNIENLVNFNRKLEKLVKLTVGKEIPEIS
jgi:hypothetical protein